MGDLEATSMHVVTVVIQLTVGISKGKSRKPKLCVAKEIKVCQGEGQL